MKALYTALLSALMLIGCGNNESKTANETLLQPQVKNAAIRPPAPPTLD